MAESSKVSVKNISTGPRGVHSTTGEVTIEAGRTVDVELSDAERKSAEGTGYFEFDGESAASEPSLLDGSVDDIEAEIANIDDPDEIDRLLKAERAGKNRKGAVSALEARRDELLA